MMASGVVMAGHVSTHSRPKAAGPCSVIGAGMPFQLTAARRRLVVIARLHRLGIVVSTHSRPKAAGTGGASRATAAGRFNSQPPEGGWDVRILLYRAAAAFQLTAARRRLGPSPPLRRGSARFNSQPPEGGWGQYEYIDHLANVSTHSRPKAAGNYLPAA